MPPADAPPTTRRTAFALALAAVTALAAYLPGLGNLHIPKIGDESLYLQIVRVTAESGRPLPLRSEEGITDTKPPLLFMQGLLSSAGGRDWDLFRLRLPVAILSLATAAAAGLLAWRLSGDVATAVVAALAFLGFRSTIQHGRAFLTNAGETLFLFLPLLLLQGRERTGPLLGLAAGLSLGVAALTKSFFVVVPGTFALGLVLLARERFDLRATLARHGPFLLVAAAVGLACFALWPLLDPRPDLVWSQFVVGENAGKVRGGWLAGLVSGPYPIWRIWLGDLGNAGLYALAVVWLAVDLWRRRRVLSQAERELWLFVLAFLLVYSLPSQRQENYLLPTCPVLAVLVALRWRELPALALRLPLAVLAAAAVVAALLVARLDASLGPGFYSRWALGVLAALALAAAAAALSTPLARAAFPYLALLAVLAVTAVLAPFSPPFPAAALAAVGDREVLVPARFRAAAEHMRFVLPGATVRPYPCSSSALSCAPPPAAGPAVLALAEGEPIPGGWSAVGEVPALRARHSSAQLRQMLGGDLTPLVERFVLALPSAGR